MNDIHIEFNILNKANQTVAASIFKDCENVSVVHQNICQSTADCIVTAANQMGYMDGGIDGSICTLLSSYDVDERIDEKVRKVIMEKYYGEQPVGSCLLMPTSHPRFKWLAHAPTMMMPQDVSNSVNAYIAFRAVLVEILNHNKWNPDNKIKKVVTPLFCTGAGNMNVKRSAYQMYLAYNSVLHPQREYDWQKAWKNYNFLLSV